MDLDATITRLHRSKSGRVGLHILLWVFYFFAVFYLQSISFNPFKGTTVVLTALKQIVSTAIIFYPLVYWVWPRYLNRKRFLPGALSIVALIIAYTTVDFFIDQAILSNCPSCMETLRNNQHGYYQLLQRGAINVIFLRLVTLGIVYQLFVFLAFPVSVKIVLEYWRQRMSALELQKENVRLEFNFLKSQVNPHFLFNTLNNVYALILKDKKEESAATVARLSTFLRYTLYETDTHSNNVLKEVNLVKDYIALEQIRLNETVVNFVSTVDSDSYNLPPLLFIPAVENAFKYCSKNEQGDAYIFMRLEIVDSNLDFVISNTFEKSGSKERDHGGIGLDNLQKRLSFYYPGNRALLLRSQENGVFKLNIKISLAS